MLLCRHCRVTWPQARAPRPLDLHPQHGWQRCLDCGSLRSYRFGEPPGPWFREAPPSDPRRDAPRVGEGTWMQILKKYVRAIRFSLVLTLFLWLTVLGVILDGCATKQPLHPGAMNAFDSQAADDLLLVQTTLCGVQSTLTTCPGGLNAEVKTHPSLLASLQAATRSYNTALILYTAWVKAAQASGTVPATVPSSVQAAITQAKTDTATAQRLLQGGTQ